MARQARSNQDDQQMEVKKPTPLAALDFSGDAGKGLEGADKDSFAIPFLVVLQGLSPQVTDGTVDGAKPGLLFNTVTQELLPNTNVIPVAFSRKYLRWVPRSEGGGFKGEMSVAEVEQLMASKQAVRDEETGQLMFDGDMLKDTRIHYVLVESSTGQWAPAVMSLSSTQIKRSKRWLSRINSISLNKPDGTPYTPPSFSHVYSVGSEKESNDKGSWFSYAIELVAPVADANLYAAAKDFHNQIIGGKVKVQHAEAAQHEDAPAPSGQF